MYRIDYHMHSNFSSDSEAEMEDMILSAIDKGLTHIALTDHVDFMYPDPEYPFLIDYDEYRKKAMGLIDKYSKKINIAFGVEMGLQPCCEKMTIDFLNEKHFDFVIGSTHCVAGLEMYGDSFYRGKKKEDAYREYFEDVLNSVKTYEGFNVYGHLDYVNRYGGYADNSLRYIDYKDIIDEILKELIERGKGLDLNTSGYRYKIGYAHPQKDILKAYREFGGEIITTGSDAHKPHDVAADFDKAYKLLREIGFKYVTVFKDRKPEFIKF
ncbi:MAG: histidinol-phosphatase HisJ family protein [Lachnospiraceae bacterium]|nr:histidinol-phosphatase HisJ family protein [Lachnospiraceae bacterium]